VRNFIEEAYVRPGVNENADFHEITSGDQLISAQVAGFQLIETRHLPGAALGRHAHADASVNFVISGGLRETVGNFARRREYMCGPGSVLYKPAAEYHSNSYGPKGARCLIIQPSAARLQSLTEGGFRVGETVYPEDPRPAQLVGRIYAELRNADNVSSLAIEADVLRLFSVLSGTTVNPKRPWWLSHARDFLVQHSRAKILLRDVALELDVDSAELSRAFHRAYGITPSEFVRKERTRWAASQLADGKRPLSDIGLSAGFVDQSHFSRTFRIHYGVTPQRYRELTARR
jgi:AraC family transcriptional regulator